MTLKKDIKIEKENIKNSLQILKNEKLDTAQLNNILNSIIKPYNQVHLNVYFENDLINNNIISVSFVFNNLKNKIKNLKKINPNDYSKKKTKKAKKAIKRLKSTIQNTQKTHLSWFMFPISKRPRPVTKSAVRNFLEELNEYLGATDLPSEKLAKEEQK